MVRHEAGSVNLNSSNAVLVEQHVPDLLAELTMKGTRLRVGTHGHMERERTITVSGAGEPVGFVELPVSAGHWRQIMCAPGLVRPPVATEGHVYDCARALLHGS